MMNRVSLIGRLTNDVELKVTPNNTQVCTFTLACNRMKAADGSQKADFINCVAWRGSAEYLSKYASKGTIVYLNGSIQTRTYDGKNGKVYVTEVVADSLGIISTKPKEQETSSVVPSEQPTFEPDDLPFY